jgi:hypothetical protein
MKSLVKYGLAAAMVFATAMPAMARSWVVCLDQNKDARGSTENVTGAPVFFVGAAPVYPGTTDVSTATDCTPNTLKATQVGTFFAFGGLVAGLPQSTTADANDLFFVIWHFRIDGKGAFDTTGPVRSSPTYPQTITGSTNPGLVPAHGKAKVTNLTTGTASTGAAPLAAFKITTPEGSTH